MTEKKTELLREVVQKCEEKGINLTSKRKMVLTVLQEHDLPLSAYEIADVLKQSVGESLPIMSIYRMLDFLVQEQLAHKLLTVNKYIACHHICEHHIHSQFLICNVCQKVTEIELPDALVAQLQQNVSEAQFTLSSPQLELAGWCYDCRQQLNIQHA